MTTQSGERSDGLRRRAGAARRRVSATDVARLAGVSQKTVSRVMNQEPLVSDDVRRRVLAAGAELGYRPSAAARALNSGRTRHIGFVSFGSALHGPVTTLVATERAARGLGYSLGITTTAAGADGITEAVNDVLQGGAEGIVMSGAIDIGAVEITVEVPVLVFGHMPGLDAPCVISVLTSGDRDAATATDYLLSLGHETVHHVAGPSTWFASRERIAGWSQTLRARGTREVAPLHGDWTVASGYDAGRRLALDPRLTAVFAANDDMAIGVIRALVEAGRSVPGDVSVVGFDDIPAAAYLWPSLTTFRNPFEADAARGVAALVGAIEHPDVPLQEVEGPLGELVIRESTAPPGRGGKSTRIAGGIATEE